MMNTKKRLLQRAQIMALTCVLIFDHQAQSADEAFRGSEIYSLCNASKTQALIGIKGRFFGGRMVHASFYGEERFRNKELASMHGEVPGYPWGTLLGDERLHWAFW
ncbi:unnamed protein product [Musa hybrid cultivar]